MVTASAAILPSCLLDKKKKQTPVSLANFLVTENQQETVAAVSDILIPETDIVGAKSIGAHLFVLKMVDDCYNKQTQDAFLKGIDQLNEISNKQVDKSFVEATSKQREQIIKKIDIKEIDSLELREFYRLTRRHTIQAFMTCEYVMTQINGYELVPGRFNGCVPAKKA